MEDEKKLVKNFDSALYALPIKMQECLLSLPPKIKIATSEIRLRVDKPLILTVGGAPMWVGKEGVADYLPPKSPIFVAANEINEIYINLCNHSVYTHEDEIKQGFIMMKHAHRAGVCGTVFSGGVRDICSINIRIAKEIKGSADRIISAFDGKGMLIAGPPSSGKTTILRDAVRQLSENFGKRITVIDSRGEIAAVSCAIPENDIGVNTDVITGAEKADGLLCALRTMAPQIVVFDEISTEREVDMIMEGLHSGVSVITTAHIGERCDLVKRPVTKRLLKSGAISKVVILNRVGGNVEILNAKDVTSWQ